MFHFQYKHIHTRIWNKNFIHHLTRCISTSYKRAHITLRFMPFYDAICALSQRKRACIARQVMARRVTGEGERRFKQWVNAIESVC